MKSVEILLKTTMLPRLIYTRNGKFKRKKKNLIIQKIHK